MKKKTGISRRRFIAGTAGLAGLAATGTVSAAPGETGAPQTVPLRPLGKTGVQVPSLALGGMFDIVNNQIVLHEALRRGVTYWDTAHSYGGGRSEKGIGKFFQIRPQFREKVFLVTKSGASRADGLARELDESLERLQTGYVDLFFVHGIGSIREMDNEVKRFGEAAKKSGKIRFFGFSTHRNMAESLSGAAKLGWIDAVMMTFNFRVMHDPALERAVDACHKAGVGLVAMKTQGSGPFGRNSEAEMEMARRFARRGFTNEQAKLMAVWNDPRIASICSQMPNMAVLQANIAACLDRPALTRSDRDFFQHMDRMTASLYCAGCAGICEGGAHGVPVADVMRALMYDRDYGDLGAAREVMAALPGPAREALASGDFKDAENACPRRLPIARLMSEATRLLA